MFHRRSLLLSISNQIAHSVNCEPKIRERAQDDQGEPEPREGHQEAERVEEHERVEAPDHVLLCRPGSLGLLAAERCLPDEWHSLDFFTPTDSISARCPEVVASGPRTYRAGPSPDKPAHNRRRSAGDNANGGQVANDKGFRPRAVPVGLLRVSYRLGLDAPGRPCRADKLLPVVTVIALARTAASAPQLVGLTADATPAIPFI